MTNPTSKYYSLWLPVFKQGDDLYQHLMETPDDSKAFLALAERYSEAAAICRRVAGGIKESNREMEINVEAGTHHIGITGPEEVFAGLLSDEVIQAYEDDFLWEDFEDENYEDGVADYESDPEGPDYYAMDED